MTTDEKRQLIYETLKKELEKNPPGINIVYPKSPAKLFYIKDVSHAESQPKANFAHTERPASPAPAPAPKQSFTEENISDIKFDNIPVPQKQEVKAEQTPVEAPQLSYEPLPETVVPEQTNDDVACINIDFGSFEEEPAKEEKKAPSYGKIYREDGFYDQDGEFIHVDDMDSKEYKKYLKEKRREEKYYERVRKDVHKRGYDTTVLEHFEEIEEVYDLSNEEIDQIRAAGFINQDGFYSFIAPNDYSELKRESLATKNVLLICGGIIFTCVVMFIGIKVTFNLF